MQQHMLSSPDCVFGVASSSSNSGTPFVILENEIARCTPAKQSSK